MSFLSVTRTLLCSFSKNRCHQSIVVSSKLCFSTSSQLKHPFNSLTKLYNKVISVFTKNENLGLKRREPKNVIIDQEMPQPGQEIESKQAYGEEVTEFTVTRKKIPTKPANAYNLYTKKNFGIVKDQNPELSNCEVMREIGEGWKGISEEEKGVYKEKAIEELKKYQSKNMAKNAILEKIPRKPVNAYSLFMKKNVTTVKEQNPGISSQDIQRKIGEDWKRISEEEKNTFKQKAHEEMEKYRSNFVSFYENLTEKEVDFLNHVAKDQMKKIHRKKLKLLNYPKKPGGAFAIFKSMEKKNFPRGDDERMTEWYKRMAMEWRSMSDEDKEMYFSASKREREKYAEDVKYWKIEQEAKKRKL